MVFIRNAGSQSVCPGPEDGFQGENEQLGLKGWQPHRIKFLTAHDPRDEGEMDAQQMHGLGLHSYGICRQMLSPFPCVSPQGQINPGCLGLWWLVLQPHQGLPGAPGSSSRSDGICCCSLPMDLETSLQPSLLHLQRDLGISRC